MAQTSNPPQYNICTKAKQRIKLSSEDVEQALSFAKDIHQRRGQSKRDFGRADLVRSQNDFHADTLEGKLAEIAFSKFLLQARGWKFMPDFDIYENPLWIDHGQDLIRLEIDGAAYQIRSRIDIKATRAASQWLLVESHKFWSDAFILVKLDLPADIEKMGYTHRGRKVNAEIFGFAYFFDIIDMESYQPRFDFPKGSRLLSTKALEKLDLNIHSNSAQIRESAASYSAQSTIPKIGPYLKAKLNYGLPINWLRNTPTEWESFFDWIQASALAAPSRSNPSDENPFYEDPNDEH